MIRLIIIAALAIAAVLKALTVWQFIFWALFVWFLPIVLILLGLGTGLSGIAIVNAIKRK